MSRAHASIVEHVLIVSIAIVSVAWVARRSGRGTTFEEWRSQFHWAEGEPRVWPPDGHERRRERVLAAVRRNVSGDALQAILDEAPLLPLRRDLANNSIEQDGPARKTALFLASFNRSPGLVRTLLEIKPQKTRITRANEKRRMSR